MLQLQFSHEACLTVTEWVSCVLLLPVALAGVSPAYEITQVPQPAPKLKGTAPDISYHLRLHKSPMECLAWQPGVCYAAAAAAQQRLPETMILCWMQSLTENGHATRSCQSYCLLQQFTILPHKDLRSKLKVNSLELHEVRPVS